MADFFLSRVRSFQYAFEGLTYVLKTQKNAWLHLIISAIVIILGIWLSIPLQDWAIVCLTMGLVWAAECVNTAIETIFDLVSPQKHPLVKIGKDVAAGAVLMSAISAILVGIFIFGPPLLSRLIQP
jgi:diacylglycerol kinase (ATP)